MGILSGRLIITHIFFGASVKCKEYSLVDAVPGVRTEGEEDREHRTCLGVPPVVREREGSQPQRGLTTKPGVAVTTAHPRRTPTKPNEPQRGSTSQMRVFRASIACCGTRTGLNRWIPRDGFLKVATTIGLFLEQKCG